MRYIDCTVTIADEGTLREVISMFWRRGVSISPQRTDDGVAISFKEPVMYDEPSLYEDVERNGICVICEQMIPPSWRSPITCSPQCSYERNLHMRRRKYHYHKRRKK